MVAANWLRRLSLLTALGVLTLFFGCGSSPKITRVTITVDGAALGTDKLASIRTIRLRVEKDLQTVDRNFAISAGALANGQYEVTYSPLSKMGMLHIVITALDADGNVLATNSADVTIKTGRNSTVTVALSGSAPPEALLVVSPSMVDFGNVVLGAPAGHMTVTLRNAGGAATGPLAVMLGGDTTSFVADPTTTCDGVALAPDATCTLTLEFRPTEAGVRAGHLLATGSPGGQGRVDLMGTGVGAALVMIDPDVADLGAVQVGQTGTGVKFTITNSGGQATGAVAVALSGTHAAEMKLGNDGCSGKALDAGATCTLTVALAPDSPGPKTANITVSGLLAFSLGADGLAAETFVAAGPGDAGTAMLTGVGLAAASLAIEPLAQDLGTVLTGGASSATFSVKNPGGLATGTLAMALTGASAAEMTLASDGCTGTALASGASCSVTVNFVPTGVGAKTALLGAHASPGGDASANLTATVAAPGALVIAPASIDFGGVLVGASTGTPNVFTVTNTGGTPSGPLALALGGSGSAQFVAGADVCTGQSLAAGSTCTVAFSFRPTTPGNKTASLVVMASPGGVGAAALIGRGLAPAVLSANATAALGTVDVGSSGPATTWTVRNTGDVPSGALMTATTGSPTDFTIVNGCTGMLGPGASCAVTVALAPKTGGDKTATVALTGAPGGTVSLVATGTGRPALPLTVARAGNGMGSVASDAGGIACGTTCTAAYRYGTVVTLTPTAVTGSTFMGWTGACTGTGVCMVPMMAAQMVTATFTLNRYTLSVTTSGPTTGTVTSAPAGIACGADCTEAYNYGAMVTLTAAPATGWAFGGWAGACTGTGACAVAMNQARSVTATFTQNSFALSVSVTGMGRIASTPAGIDCGSDCGEAYPSGQTVQLSATAAAGYTLAAWGGACTGTVSPCSVTMSQARDVTATFRANPAVLTVAMRGNGRVASSPAGIVCDTSRTADCTETYAYGDRIALTATPAAGSDIAWSGGGCTGNGPTCTVTLAASATTVTVDFVLQQFGLGVKVVGAAADAGQVTSTDKMIDCPAGKCEAAYGYGTQVTLVASAVQGKAVFVGWDWPACKAVGGVPPATCAVPITMSTTVQAQFELPVRVTIRVVNTGGVPGSVSSTPAGIDMCTGVPGVPTGTCTAIFAPGATVRLAATVTPGYPFVGWDKAGACANFGAEPVCTIDLKTTSVTAVATFTKG